LAVRDLARALRNDFAYEAIRVSYPKDSILDQIEETVSKGDLMEALDIFLPGWDEDPEGSEDEEESDDDSSDNDEDGEEEE
jgi:hypothetical protein